MKAIRFDIPEVLLEELGLEGLETFMHQYLVTENGDVMVPWYDFIDPEGPDNAISCAVHDEVEYFDASDLMSNGLEELRETLKSMLLTLIKHHNARFDQQEKGEA